MRSSVKHFYEFGPFRLDAEKLRLTRDGEIVPLSRKDIESLLVLVRHPGKPLEREELMQAVWGDTVVEDANLTVASSHLRKARETNGDAAEYRPKGISTIRELLISMGLRLQGMVFTMNVRKCEGRMPRSSRQALGCCHQPAGPCTLKEWVSTSPGMW